LPPETLRSFGGPERLAEAVNGALDALAAIVGDDRALAELLGVS
jgi:hypothetical protein